MSKKISSTILTEQQKLDRIGTLEHQIDELEARLSSLVANMIVTNSQSSDKHRMLSFNNWILKMVKERKQLQS